MCRPITGYCLDGSFKTANLRDDPQMSLSILKTRGDRGRSAYGARPPLEFYVVTIIFLGHSGNMTLCTSHGNVKLVSKKIEKLSTKMYFWS